MHHLHISSILPLLTMNTREVIVFMVCTVIKIIRFESTAWKKLQEYKRRYESSIENLTNSEHSSIRTESIVNWIHRDSAYLAPNLDQGTRTAKCGPYNHKIQEHVVSSSSKCQALCFETMTTLHSFFDSDS